MLCQALLGVTTGGKAKIGELDVGVIVLAHQQKILGFHVTVGDSVRMAIGHGLEHFDSEVTSIFFGVGFLFTDSVKEITSAHEFHHEEVTILFFEKINQWNNVGMREGGHDGNFVVNGSVVVGWEVLPKHAFDGHLFPARSMRSTAHRRERSRLELQSIWNGTK